MCWPLSRSAVLPPGSATESDRARPPSVRAASSSVTVCPCRVAATAAARPAQPAPTTAIFNGQPPPGLSAARPAPPLSASGGGERLRAAVRRSRHPPKRLHLPCEPQLAHRREADALVQHPEVLVLDLAQQRAVDAGHH